jgi:hypothetical protein
MQADCPVTTEADTLQRSVEAVPVSWSCRDTGAPMTKVLADRRTYGSFGPEFVRPSDRDK